MSLITASLIAEGGGMRGAYTAGVLEAFYEHNLHFNYALGVSAGANTLCGYLSHQLTRNKRLYTEWITDKRFINLSNLWREGAYFGMDFLFNELPLTLDPFDYETFKKSQTCFKVGVTHCQSGRAMYMRPLCTSSPEESLAMLRASSSLPGIAKPVYIRGQYYLDGAIADPIPIQKSIEDGNTHHVLILTRNQDYRSSYQKTSHLLAKRYLKQFPATISAVAHRHIRYNETLEQIAQMEKEGTAFVIRPIKPLEVDRFEKNPDKLKALYEQGYEEALASYSSLQTWLLHH